MYFTSVFLGHTTADDLLDTLKTFLNNMDGPSVNWKFYEFLSSEREKFKLSRPIDIGNYSLHVLRGVFKTATEATGWNIKRLPEGLFELFNDSLQLGNRIGAMWNKMDRRC